ncbi:uncharacterized protein LOC101847543 [Aplysia californica]|uniref:Globin n=1 Tax=Aplysia californica TaxID=6500 RepID=A0ABM0JB77_APLCA|nr:uncharacterized protein LOC101847543 [Aplysia californica]
MGCFGSKNKWDIKLPPPRIPDLTDDDLVNVRELWDLFCKLERYDDIALQLFISLFHHHPEAVDYFQSGKSAKKKSTDADWIIWHARLSMMVVNSAVMQLDSPEDVRHMLLDMRDRHRLANGPQLVHFEQLMKDMDKMMQDRVNKRILSPEAKESWRRFLLVFFGFITKDGLLQPAGQSVIKRKKKEKEPQPEQTELEEQEETMSVILEEED